MAEDNTTEFMATEPLEPPTIMMTIPSPPPVPASLAPASLAPRALTPVPELMEPATPLPFEPAVLALAPAEPFALAPATLAEPGPAETVHDVPATLALAPAEPFALALVRQSKVDLLFTTLSTNTIILSTVHNIKTRGKFEESRSKFEESHSKLEASDIPILLLGIYNEYQNNNKKVVLTIDDLQILIERVYNYLVDKYTLIDLENQAVCFLMFSSALKLLLAVPAVKNKKCFFTCF